MRYQRDLIDNSLQALDLHKPATAGCRVKGTLSAVTIGSTIDVPIQYVRLKHQIVLRLRALISSALLPIGTASSNLVEADECLA